MAKFFPKIRKGLILAAASIALLSPAIAAASGEVYYWQDTNRKAIVASGGEYKAATTTLTGSGTSFAVSKAVTCNDGTSQGNVTLKVSAADYQSQTDPTPGVLAVSCDSATTIGSVKVYATKATAATASSSADSGDSCKGGLLSYVICPVYDFILNSIDSIEKNVITPFLQLTPITTQSNPATYKIWTQFRNLANVGFIIAFLMLIFAHTLSIGLDSYSIKKTLPRLVYAAILMQFSYILVALGVDLTNLIGAGLQNLVLAPLSDATLVVGNSGGVTSLIGLAAGIGVALAAAGGLVTGTLLLVLFGAFFAVIGVFLTLIARQILVTLLLIISPLAFMAWILPNTEHLFKLWRTSLIRLLMMYPMIVLLFTAGKLFSAAIIVTDNQGIGGTVTNAFLPLVSIVAYILPLFFIPLTFKYAGAALTTVNGWITSFTTGTKKGIESSERYAQVKTRTQQRRTEMAAGQKIKFLGGEVGGSFVSKQVARGVFSVPSTGSNVRAMVALNKDIDSWKKRLEEENMTYEGKTYLSLGEGWYQKEKADIQTKLSAARASGNTNEVALLEGASDRLEQGKQFASVYSGNVAARAAALMMRSDMDVLEDADRVQAMEYTGFNSKTELGKLLGDQLWNRAREGARKTNVHLVFKDSQGNLNAAELQKYVSKKPAGSWVEYTKDAVQTMKDSGVLENLAQDRVTRQILINTLSHSGGPSTGAEQQKIITEVLKSTGAPAGPPLKDDSFWI